MLKSNRFLSLKPLITSFLLCMLILIPLAGCAQTNDPDQSTAKTPAVSEIGDKIGQTVNLTEMKKGDSAKLQKLYDIDPTLVEDFILYTAPSNIKADELAIIKVKDSNNVEQIKEKLDQRVQAQGTSFKDYLPEEYAIIEKHILKSKGNYVLLTISKDSAAIEKIFDDMLK